MDSTDKSITFLTTTIMGGEGSQSPKNAQFETASTAQTTSEPPTKEQTPATTKEGWENAKEEEWGQF
jgi:hypothetical protein